MTGLTLYFENGATGTPITTGQFALRLSPYTANKHLGTHLSYGMWDFGDVGSEEYKVYYSTDSWVTESEVGNAGIIPVSRKTSDTFTTLKASTVLQADTIAEYSSGAGVTIDGVLLKDGAIKIDTISEKTSTAGVTIDGVLNKDAGVTCSGASTFTGGVSVTTTAITSSVAPRGANDLVNKTYADALVPNKYWYGRVTGDSTSPTIAKLAGNLGGEISITRTSAGVYNLNSATLFTANKTHIGYANISDGLTDCKFVDFDNVSTSLIKVNAYDVSSVATDKIILDVEIKVFS